MRLSGAGPYNTIPTCLKSALGCRLGDFPSLLLESISTQRYEKQIIRDSNMKKSRLMTRLVLAAAGAVFALQASSENVYSETFDAMDTTAATIPGWKFFDQNFDDANCTNITGTFGPDALGNRNYTTTNSSADPYFRAGLEAGNDNVISGTSMRVYENFYASAACNRILVFVEFTTGISAGQEYTFSAKMMEQKYGTNVAGSAQGMFYKVLDVSAGYAETLVSYEPITAPATATAQEVTFTTPADMAADDILQIGFYAQGPTNQTSGAVWDDVSLDAAAAASGGGGGGAAAGGDATAVPALPVGGLLGLIGLIGLMGLRRKL
jgi:hypothetical protein